MFPTQRSHLSHRPWFGLALALAMNVSAASTDSFAGLFASDDELFSSSFSLSVDGLVTVSTLSYAGGLNGLGAAVSAGGFAPELSLFDLASGALVQWAVPGSCAASPVDPNTHFAWDACFSTQLTIGNYRLVLSQNGNDPLGGLADGFSQTGNANFTAVNGLDPNAMFVDLGGAQRDGHWALEMALPPPVPEPSTWFLLAAGLLGLRLSSVVLRAVRHLRKLMRLASGLGANRSDTRRYREDLQQRHGVKGAVLSAIECATTH